MKTLDLHYLMIQFVIIDNKLMPAQRKWLIEGSILLQLFLDKMTRIYRSMSILVRREQEKYFLG